MISTATQLARGLKGRLSTAKSLAELEELTLIQRAGVGRDQRAFAELVRRHEGKVRGLLLRLTSSPVVADDLGQETFLRAFRGLEHFEGRARFSTWIYRIAYNVFLNYKTRTKQFGALPEGLLERRAAPRDEMAPERHDLRHDLDLAMAALPDRYRAVITLYYLQELSYPEIAECLELPLGTVKTHLHRAKRLLRDELPGFTGRREA